MKNKIDLKIIQATIDDLKNNPDACTMVSGAIKEDGVCVIEESKPGKQLSEFIAYIYKNNLLDINYLENNKELQNKDVKDMNMENILTKITWIIRGDRFNSGLIYSCFSDGTLLKLVERINELNSNVSKKD